LLPILVVYRIRAHVPGEKLDRAQEGALVYFTLRPAGVLFAAGLAAWLLHPGALAWASVPLPGKVRALGVAAGLLGGLLMVWTLHHLGKNLTDTVVTRKDHTLVQTGPYRWVRHPFYDSLALLLLSASVVAANAFLALAGTAVLILIAIRTRREEELLLARFGNQYRAYTIRTGRFFPRP